LALLCSCSRTWCGLGRITHFCTCSVGAWGSGVAGIFRLHATDVLKHTPVRDPHDGKALGAVLLFAFIDQLIFGDLPCPLCILQRAGLSAAGFGLVLNLHFGPRPSHYGLMILGAVVAAVVALHQILLDIVLDQAPTVT